MDGPVTLPQRLSALPVRTLRAEVLEGPDAGRSHVASGETLSVGTAQGNDLTLSDPTVSRYHVELTRRPDGILLLDHGSTNGTIVESVQIERAVVPAGARLKLGSTVLSVGEGDQVTVELHGGDALGRLRGMTPVMRRLMARVERAASADSPVLLVGESGTGKELIAHALHELGPRAQGPLVTIDCGALPATLIASELFGHERGAFTGADRRHVGTFERADGGTLFLDEVGELPPALQPSLLGVLERRRLRRLGGRDEIPFDVRIVSATNRDLRSEVNAGSFRLDLYYRLAVVVLQVAPLRDRAEDIPLLVEHFLRECGYDEPMDTLFSEAAIGSLLAHHWPGNVRELHNLIEATVAMGEPPAIDDGVDASQTKPVTDLIGRLLELPYKEARATVLREFEVRYLSKLLERADGNVSGAARMARMNRSHLIDLLRRHQMR